MLAAFPFTLISLVIYNLVAFAFPSLLGADLFSIVMFSGETWAVKTGDLMVIAGLIFLFLEVLRSTASGSSTMLNHMASVVVLIIYVIEFITVRAAATSTFFILAAISVIDVMAGFTITTKVARRDISFTGTTDQI